MSETPCYCGPGYVCDEHPTAVKVLIDLTDSKAKAYENENGEITVNR